MTFRAFALRLPHAEKDRKFLLFVDPGVKDAYLPKDGENYKIHSETFEFRPIDQSKEQHQERVSTVIKNVFKIFQNSQKTKDPVTLIRDNTQHLLASKFTEEDITALLQKRSEDEIEEVRD